MDGQGCDRHLLGLKLVMEPEESVELFQDPLVQKSSQWTMSTSGLGPNAADDIQCTFLPLKLYELDCVI